MPFLCLAIFAISAVADWVAVTQEQTRVEYVAKPAALAALIGYAATAPDPSAGLVIALVLSLLGDVYLMLPADLFAAGLGSFLLAHVAYIAEFDATWLARLAWWLVVLAASYPVARRIVRAIDDPTLRPAVVVYMATIGLMVASALASGSLLAAGGAILFFVSDAIIAWDRFVRKLSWARPAIMVTYHVGQLGLVLALRSG
ncbi:MAG TPA: lysoplasmalogenase [Candidatus Kryptonia bacterium]|nr:lysoplasmalogenase [Candidatus Kryptonia bacterium]